MDQEKVIRSALFWMKYEKLIVQGREERAKEYIREIVAICFCEGTKNYGHSNGKKIIQCNISGIKIEEYDNQLQAARAVGYTDRAILRSLKSGRKTRAGHIWKYADDERTL